MATIKTGTMKEILIKNLCLEKDYRVPDKLDALVDSMLTYGILEPLVVVGPNKGGKYEVISGEARYCAAKAINDGKNETKVDKLPCYVVAKELSEEEKIVIMEQVGMEIPDAVKRERHRLQVVGMICAKAARGEIEKKSVISRVEKSFGIEPRYARMYVQIYKKGSAKLHEALLCDVSCAEQKRIMRETGKTSVPVHITAQMASKVCVYSKKEQNQILARVNGGERLSAVLEEYRTNHRE